MVGLGSGWMCVCERRIEVFVKIHNSVGGGASYRKRGLGRGGGSGWGAGLGWGVKNRGWGLVVGLGSGWMC